MKEKIINSRNIPLPIQREVRKRCGFGCVICGLPLYEYEHMEEWAVVKRHVADEITLLCNRHHREKTSGLLPKEIVVLANQKPYNFREEISKPYDLHYYGNDAEVVIGNIGFKAKDEGYGTQIIPLLIDNVPIIGVILADNHYLLNLLIFDDFNNLILHIKNNELKFKVDIWDIQLVGRTLTIRQKHRSILIEIEFKTPNKIIFKKGKFLFNGVEFTISQKNGLKLNNKNITVSGLTIISPIGLVVGENKTGLPSMLNYGEVNRYNR